MGYLDIKFVAVGDGRGRGGAMIQKKISEISNPSIITIYMPHKQEFIFAVLIISFYFLNNNNKSLFSNIKTEITCIQKS